MRISDWSSDVCSSDLNDRIERAEAGVVAKPVPGNEILVDRGRAAIEPIDPDADHGIELVIDIPFVLRKYRIDRAVELRRSIVDVTCRREITKCRSEEHKSALQQLMRHTYAVF